MSPSYYSHIAVAAEPCKEQQGKLKTRAMYIHNNLWKASLGANTWMEIVRLRHQDHLALWTTIEDNDIDVESLTTILSRRNLPLIIMNAFASGIKFNFHPGMRTFLIDNVQTDDSIKSVDELNEWFGNQTRLWDFAFFPLHVVSLVKKCDSQYVLCYANRETKQVLLYNPNATKTCTTLQDFPKLLKCVENLCSSLTFVDNTKWSCDENYNFRDTLGAVDTKNQQDCGILICAAMEILTQHSDTFLVPYRYDLEHMDQCGLRCRLFYDLVKFNCN